MLKRSLLLALALLMPACLMHIDDRLDDADPTADGALIVRSCSDIDDSELSRANSAEHAARWDGVACVAPLEGGDQSGSFFECGYGGDPGVCGQSSGLQVFGCRCWGGRLRCQDGVAIAAHEEAVGCPRDGGPGAR